MSLLLQLLSWIVAAGLVMGIGTSLSDRIGYRYAAASGSGERARLVTCGLGVAEIPRAGLLIALGCQVLAVVAVLGLGMLLRRIGPLSDVDLDRFDVNKERLRILVDVVSFVPLFALGICARYGL